MLVYRICSKEEIDLILNNGNFDLIGGLGTRYGCNNHKYMDNIHYMHFFWNKYDVIYHYFKKGKCICTYDIPLVILNKYKGVGQYKDIFCLEEYMTNIDEFAIPTEILKIDYLMKVEVFYAGFIGNQLRKYYYVIGMAKKILFRKLYTMLLNQQLEKEKRKKNLPSYYCYYPSSSRLQ